MTRDHALAVLQKLRTPLEARGVAHAAIFGSVARGEDRPHSDVDVVITPTAQARLDLIDLGAIQTLLDEGFGTEVDVVVEPIRKTALRDAVQRDRRNAF